MTDQTGYASVELCFLEGHAIYYQFVINAGHAGSMRRYYVPRC